MNTLTLAQRVIEALGTDESRLPVPRLVARIPDALVALAETIHSVDESKLSPVDRQRARAKKELLRKEFQASVTSDVADLSLLTTGDDFLLVSSLVGADIFEDGAAEPASPLQYVPDRSSLALDRSNIFGYYALEGDKLYLKNVENDITFKAGFVPTLNSLPKQLEADLVALLASMMGTKK